uniref:ARAD1D41470p n=1 Tax=Blastobotrys adeninivorans TaxID=409370 RepID=A0A060TCT1_BLAAD
MRLLQKWALSVGSTPRFYILWPASLAFVLSYVTLYSLFTEQLPSVPVPRSIPTGTPSLYAKQVLIYSQHFPNYIDNRTADALDPLLSLGSASSDDKTNPLGLPLVVSAWTLPSNGLNSTDLMRSVMFSPTLSGFPNSLRSGEDLSAAALLVSYFFQDPKDGQIWDQRVSSLVHHSQLDQFFQFTTITTGSDTRTDKSMSSSTMDDQLQPFNFFPGCPFPYAVTTIAWLFIISYMWMVLTDNESVLSEAGLAVTFVVQMFLCITAALTATSFIVPGFSHYHIRQFVALPYLVTVVGIQQMLSLLNAIAKTPPENSPLSRVSQAAEFAIPQSAFRAIVGCVILAFGLLPFNGFSLHARGLCLFMIFSIFLCLGLHATFFMAVISVDLRRLELQDLIFFSNSNSRKRKAALSKWPRYFKQQEEPLPSPLSDSVVPLSSPPRRFGRIGYSVKSFIYNNRLYFKTRSPITYWTLIFVSILIYFRLLSVGYFEEHLSAALRHPSGRTVFFLNPLLNSVSSWLHFVGKNSLLKIYEPVVLYSHHSTPYLTLAPPLDGALSPPLYGFLSVHLMLEFLASLGFVTSLTGIVLKFILPKSVEMPDETELDAVKFISKDLTSYHSLDIVRTVVDRCWIITVTLDHKVFVWNASSAARKQNELPVLVPMPRNFWPLSKLLANCNSGLVFLFSKNVPAVLAWNFKTHQQQYLFHSAEFLSSTPVHVFYYETDVIIVTRQGSLLVVPPDGDGIQVLAIDPEAKDCEVVASTCLFTPRMAPQLICVTSAQEIIVGTLIGQDWRFKRLNILESMSAIPKNQRDPLFSSQFTDEFSVEMSKKMMTAPPTEEDLSPKEPLAIPSTRPYVLREPVSSVIPVPAINMVLLTSSTSASLMDVQTGTILQHFRVGLFKKGTLRLFHSQPTHCRFCGCASVESISLAYCDEEDDSTVIMHTFMVENRAKNTICLRVERDPRETRCVGFEAATEHQHWIDRVEGWDTTEMNMIMGVRRKECKTASEDSSSTATVATSISLQDLADPNLVDLKTNEDVAGNNTKLRNRSSQPEKSLEPCTPIWEGWAMSAVGHVTFYEIPNFEDTKGGGIPGRRNQLLVQRIGPVTKFGSKSVAVGVGNAMKILYFGNEESYISESDAYSIREPTPSTTGRPSRAMTPTTSNTPVSAAKKWRRFH